MAELPYDSYQVALIAHPNIVAGHGEFQLRSWLADCLRAGLVIIPAIEGWQATIIAADCVIGDNGAVTTYAAALGRPTLLGVFPPDGVVPGTAVDQLGREAPRLRSDSSLREQIDDCMATWDPAVSARVRELVSSAPDEAAVRLRRLFYSILELPEPAHEAAVSVLTAAGLPGGSGVHRPLASVVGHTIDHPTRTVRLTRYAAEIQPSGVQSAPPRRSHLVVGLDHPGRNMRQSADVIVDDLTGAEETAGLLDEYPGALIIALITGDRCLVRTRDGVIIEFTVTERSVDLAAFASVAHCWLVEDLPVTALCPGITVDLSGRRVWAEVTVSDPTR